MIKSSVHHDRSCFYAVRGKIFAWSGLKREREEEFEIVSNRQHFAEFCHKMERENGIIAGRRHEVMAGIFLLILEILYLRWEIL